MAIQGDLRRLTATNKSSLPVIFPVRRVCIAPKSCATNAQDPVAQQAHVATFGDPQRPSPLKAMSGVCSARK
jgi:hypothetical protein